MKVKDIKRLLSFKQKYIADIKITYRGGTQMVIKEADEIKTKIR